jgi:hypothetical protein
MLKSFSTIQSIIALVRISRQRRVTPTSMPLKEDVVLPAPHPQEDAPDDGEVAPVGRVQRHLGCGASRKFVVGRGRFEIDDGNGPALLASLGDFPGGRRWPASVRTFRTLRTSPLNMRPGAPSKAISTSSPGFTRSNAFCWKPAVNIERKVRTHTLT